MSKKKKHRIMKKGMTGEQAIAEAARVIAKTNDRWMSLYGGLAKPLPNDEQDRQNFDALFERLSHE